MERCADIMIKINSSRKRPEFHLQSNNSSYILKVLPTGHLSNLYYGKKIRHKKSFASLEQNFNIEIGNSVNYIDNFFLDNIKLELATYGKGDYREPSVHLVAGDQSRVSDFLYKGYRIVEGRPELENLPHVRAAQDTETLEVTLYDQVLNIEALLYYTIFHENDIFCRSVKLVNKSEVDIRLRKIMSFNLDFNDDQFELLTLEGKWIHEHFIDKQELNKGGFYLDSKKGVSSSEHNPFICLKRKETTENSGECYGFALVYSGNHQGLVEVNPHNITRVQMGINPFDFEWKLKASETFQTPEVLLTYSSTGLNGMSQNFHQIVNNNLIPERWRYKGRPILINNWEATYFDFNEKKLLKLARTAKDMGIELFVLDDGWFGKRNDDTSSLGDWYVNNDKIPSGIDGLSKKINDIGLDFGIWVEPEMVSPDSELYKTHPEWAIKLNNREPSYGRNQLMLDLSNPEVVDYLYEVLSRLFSTASISYVKWDMNRNISDLYSNYLPEDRQQELAHRYVLGLYNLLDKLTSQFSDILFESCASGGNRFDLGMLYYMPQTWTSDNTDAGERLYIQYGTGMVYPLSTMGAHVSAVPSHQVLRNTPLETRFNVAAFGLLGYELDLNKLGNFERKLIKKQIEFYKKHRKLLQYGRFYRIKSPFASNHCIWMVVSPDQEEALLGYYQKLQESSPGLETIKLEGLKEEFLYQLESRQQYFNIKRFGELINRELPVNIKEGSLVHKFVSDYYLMETEHQEVCAYGDELMYAGFKPYNQFMGTGYNEKIRFIGDFGSRVYYINMADGDGIEETE